MNEFAIASSLIISGDLLAFMELVSEKPDLIRENEFGESLLHIAVDNTDFEIAKLLLQLNADPNVENCSGESALHVAVFRGSMKIVKLLLMNKAFVNKKCLQGKTALHYAAENRDPDIIKLLLLYGADGSIEDNNRKRPADFSGNLHILFEKPQIPIVSEVTPSEESDSLITEKVLTSSPESLKLTTQRNTYKEELFEFLSEISLEEYFGALISAGFDNLDLMAFQMKTPVPITNDLLFTVGIQKPGDRSKLIVHLEKYGFHEDPLLFSKSLEGFLYDLGLHEYYSRIIVSGYTSLSNLTEAVLSPNSFPSETLVSHLGIIKLGHQMRLLGALKYFSLRKSQSSCKLL